MSGCLQRGGGGGIFGGEPLQAGLRLVLPDAAADHLASAQLGYGLTVARDHVRCGVAHDRARDNDGDAVYAIYEADLGSDPNNADTDGDGWDDFLEWVYTTDAALYVLDPTLTPDDDDDGVYQVYEADLGSDPLSADTDGDGWDDFTEWVNGLAGYMTNATVTPDDDRDGLYAVHEKMYGCRLRNPDSDADGWTDWEEVVYEGVCNKRATTPDDDGDGLYRVYELDLGTGPRNPDSDADGVSDGDEYWAGTDPLDPLSH